LEEKLNYESGCITDLVSNQPFLIF